MTSLAPRLVCLWPVLLACGCASKPPPASATVAPVASETAGSKGHLCAQIPSLANAPEPIDGAIAPVLRIEVRGSKHAEEVCGAIQSRPGALVDDKAVEGDVRRIWGLGNIDDVIVARELAPGGVVLSYEIKERKRFVSARIDGARTAGIGRDEDFLPEPGPLDPVKIHEGIMKLTHALSEQGFRHARVMPRTEPRDDDGLELVFDVDLGTRAVVRNITFPGADASRTGEIARLLATHTGAPLLADAIERDVLVVTSYYFDHGMLTVRVHPATIQESGSGDALDVAIQVEEGPIFKIGNVKLVGDLLDREADYKKRFWSSPPGAIFNRSVIVQDIDRIREYHKSQGFNADVEPDTDLMADKKLVDITIRVKKH